MKTMSVRDVCQRWPEAERALQDGDEVIVTRNGTPVARIVAFEPRVRGPHAAVDWGALERWRSRFWRTQPRQARTDDDLAAGRAERGSVPLRPRARRVVATGAGRDDRLGG